MPYRCSHPLRGSTAFLALAALLVACGPAPVTDGKAGLVQPEIDTVSIDGFDALLATYVDGHGLVNYRELKAHRGALDAFVADLGRLDPAAFETWDAAAKKAFWINAYNAITLVRIIDHYPIDRGGLIRGALYPANSIRQIDGVWTDLTTPVMGRPMTLDHIEHQILRVEFGDPRIHAAIVCAAKGCPPLRAEAYRPDRIDAQLDDQGRRFLGAAHRFRIDRGKNLVYLSPILKWFAEDFVKKYGELGPVGKHNANDSAALRYAMQYVSEDDAMYIESATYRVEYLDYDWSLNEQP